MVYRFSESEPMPPRVLLDLPISSVLPNCLPLLDPLGPRLPLSAPYTQFAPVIPICSTSKTVPPFQFKKGGPLWEGLRRIYRSLPGRRAGNRIPGKTDREAPKVNFVSGLSEVCIGMEA